MGHRHISWKHVWQKFCLSYHNEKLSNDVAVLQDHSVRNHSQIVFREDFGTDRREGYFDHYEIIRDIIESSITDSVLSEEVCLYPNKSFASIPNLRNPNDPFRTGPKEFADLWSCLGQWRAIFERFDRDRSGKIDVAELRDALYSLGYVIPPSVLQLLISLYNDQSGRRAELSFDSFVE